MENEIIIIGAGASGLAAGVTLSKENKYHITIIEASSKVGKKILASGNGRANISNTNMDITKYNCNSPIVEETIKRNIVEFFQELKMEVRYDNNLIYPYSNTAQTIKDILCDNLFNTDIVLDTVVKKINPLDNGYEVITSSKSYKADYVLICTGSKAGNFKDVDESFLDSLRLKKEPLTPVLVSLKTKEVYKGLKGVRTKALLILNNEIKESGEILFTDYGVSGICVMQLSRYLKGNDVLSADVLPDFSKDYLNKRKEKYKLYYYQGLLNPKLVEVINKYKLDPKNIKFNIVSKMDYSKAQVMRGGISLSEIDSSFMLKKYPHIYACGEVLDVDGDCGGYNLHFAFSSGIKAGESIIKEDKKC
ncbi:MAG: NAD(P)/FAD-dependent oxidoreductase [Thomasclavelia sp.]|nr:NAD(P)/FAD-dependent oxidoreductase [Thomasclavelia sp.]